MGAKIPVTLGPKHFTKKGDAISFLNAMLSRYDVGDRVSAEDAVILEAALARHPEAKERIGAGIKNFSVRSAEYGTKCFWVNRLDGTTGKFSHKKI
ncbi:DCL family protein [Methylobacterium brachiatum]|uniref:DCL family protein n=1 Tax=Methylobacterium brachiatum TaxID=269660 RepID=UPI000B83F1EE|nr:DCL family protein [Methylobacterium brachiatum]